MKLEIAMRRTRRRLRLTQRALAEILGVHHITINRYETGKRRIGHSKRPEIAAWVASNRGREG